MKKYNNATDNSANVCAGDLFISFPAANAQQYLDDAVARGAVAVALPADSQLIVPAGMDEIRTNDINLYAAEIAREYMPVSPKHICAVTGTKGKTSVVSFIVQIMKMLGKSAASIGTLGVVSDKWIMGGNNTTPRIFTLREWMAHLAADGVEYLALEASSHGIEQKRLEFIDFDAVGFTNFSRDHLDYHKTVENYFAAKSRLFSDFHYGTAVMNMDDDAVARVCPHGRIISFGRRGTDIKIKNITHTPNGQVCDLAYFGRDIVATTPLIGEFQVYNILMAIGLVIGMGFAANELPVEDIFSNLRAPTGRAEYVGRTRTGATVYVDYAHTPDSLEKIILALRPGARGKLVVLFGCGGDRDTGKRPIMGEIAARLADTVYVTDDNPRTEDADKIRAAVMAGCPNATEIADRAVAIKTAIHALNDGDLLIVAGKGHEDYQIIGKTKHHFSDREEILRVISD